MDALNDSTVVFGNTPKTATDQETQQGQRIPVHLTVESSELITGYYYGSNPLFNICSPILALVVKIPNLPMPEDIDQFKETLIDEVEQLKTKGNQLDFPVAVIDKLCFLCTIVIDEVILNCEWGEDSGWANNTLLSELFGLRNGGELFYKVTEQALRQPQKMLPLLEIIYIFLQTGFKGQFRSENTRKRLDLIRTLDGILKKYAPQPDQTPFVVAQNLKGVTPRRPVNFLIITILFFCLIAFSYSLTSYWYSSSESQRARDFITLAGYSDKYILSQQMQDIIYSSNSRDLDKYKDQSNKLNQLYSNAKANTLPPSNTASAGTNQGVFLVQLASFKTLLNADKFRAEYHSDNYPLVTERSGKYYIVAFKASSINQANQVKSYFENKKLRGILIRFERNNG